MAVEVEAVEAAVAARSSHREAAEKKGLKRMNILLTGTRHTVAVDLARVFHKNGHKVFSADTTPRVLTSFSSSVEKHVVVPSPRFE